MSLDERPLVSVLLPVFDAGATLAACLRSVRRQSWKRWECVIIDDGSADDTGRVAREFRAGDERFSLISTEHSGLVAALNSGLVRCRGRYIARMDADDVMHRRRIEEQVNLLEANPELSAAGCHVRVFPRASLGPGFRAYEHWINGIDSPERLEREAFVECPIAHPTLCIRRERLLDLGYRDRGWPEDYDLILRMLAARDRIGVVPRRLLSWRHGPERLSLNDRAYTDEKFTECKAAFLASSFLADTDGYILWGYGGTGRALCRALAKLGKHPTHIIEVHSGRVGNVIHGAPVLLPAALRTLRGPIIVSVSGARPRTEIRAALASMGFTELRDFVCAA